MRQTLVILAVLLMPVSAFALSESAIEYCLSTSDPKGCIKSISTDIDQRHAAQQYDAQLEQARIQANGMAMFGAGSAIINGMNQGFNNMRLPSQVHSAPIYQQQFHQPLNCTSQQNGQFVYTNCY